MIGIIIGGFVLFGIIMLITSGFGHIGHKITASKNRRNLKNTDDYINLIDKHLGTVIGIQHAWAQTNWHSLDRVQKYSWVNEHRAHLMPIADSKTSMDTISVMQKADINVSHPASIPAQDPERWKRIFGWWFWSIAFVVALLFFIHDHTK